MNTILQSNTTIELGDHTMSTIQYETEEVSDLKQEIADYLGMEHGGYRDGSELDAIRAAEHIVSTFVEPLIREAKAQALEETADDVTNIDGRKDDKAAKWLRNRAQQLKEEA